MPDSIDSSRGHVPPAGGRRVRVAVLVATALAGGALLGVFVPRLLSVQPEARAQPPPPPATPEAATAATAVAAEAAGNRLTFEQIERAIRILNADQRAQVLRDKETFVRLVKQEAARKSVLAAARAAGLDKDPDVAYLMRRRSEQMLVDLYLQRVTQGRVPADFPSAEQMRALYDQNPAQFTAEERVAIWQIFLPVSDGMGEQAIAELEAKAKRVAGEIRSGKVTFAEAAATHSGHAGSRFNGGDMGLLKVSDLLPEIRNQILALEEGAISAPLRAGDGFHIVKRGALVPSHRVPLQQVQGELRQRLRRLAMLRLRQAAIRQTGESQAAPPSDTTIEAWRLKLRAGALK